MRYSLYAITLIAVTAVTAACSNGGALCFLGTGSFHRFYLSIIRRIFTRPLRTSSPTARFRGNRHSSGRGIRSIVDPDRSAFESESPKQRVEDRRRGRMTIQARIFLFCPSLRGGAERGPVQCRQRGYGRQEENPHGGETGGARVDPSVEKLGALANPVDVGDRDGVREGGSPVSFPHVLSENDGAEKYPLVLWLHGLGEGRGDNESQLMHMQTSIDVLAGPDRPDFYLAAVQCSIETMSWAYSDPRTPNGETPLEMLDKITRALVEEYPIDVDRISLLGICSGVTAGFDLIEKFPNRFSAFVACSENAPNGNPRTYRHQPIWMFNNRNDNYSVDDNLYFASSVNEVWGDVYVTVHDEGGHNTWTRAQRDYRVMEWMLRQRRGRFAFPRDVSALDRPKGKAFLLFMPPIFLLAAALLIPRKVGKKK